MISSETDIGGGLNCLWAIGTGILNAVRAIDSLWEPSFVEFVEI
jgi:hypothetical protein